MNLHSFIESKYAEQTEDFASSRAFSYLENGSVSRQDYDNFIAAVCRTHLKSPQILAFLYSAAPPAAAENIKHNMLEELGLDEEGVSHPALLFDLAAAIGLDESAREKLESAAQEKLRQFVTEPILFGTLREVGLSVLLETASFEWMLSRLAGRMSDFLSEHRRLSRENLRWFYHHSEVDVRHAEESLQAAVDYVEFYEFDSADVEIILDVTFRENVFIKRYFGEIALAEQAGVLS
jgi:Iron-containing redox enzyme